MKISVCVASFNGAKYIRKQIDSILNQNVEGVGDVELELIVSDDGSTDGTIEILESYGDGRIRIVRHERKKKHRYNKAIFAATENFVNAMKYASGDYIFLSDQDDVWHPNKMIRQIEMLKKNGGGLCSHSLVYITEDGKLLGHKSCNCKSFLWMCKNSPLHGMSMCMSRDFLDKVMPFPGVLQHDIFLALYAKWKNRLWLIEEGLVAHRILAKGANASYSAGATPWVVKLWYRVRLIVAVFCR